MIKELKIRVLPKQASSEYNITQAVSQEYAIDLSSIKAIRVLKLDRRPSKTGYDQHAIKSIYQ